ncbi:MAG: type II toxin-antitoxin system RelE/ParE family toxin [Sideroxydans sp.]|nr:type II toxin-antitoxin system RelE/ParE family toxin [Sideroxydans sp.]
MLKSVEYSTRARNHLKKIKVHIAQDNEIAALRVVTHITTEADLLAEFPMIGKSGEIDGTRELVLSKYPYTIIYRLTSSKVRIVAVLHQSQDHA